MLSVNHIRKAYFHRSVLKSISFEIQPGEVVGILGKNGAGKSTLLRMISGISSLDKGSISLFDTLIESGNIDPRKSLFYIGHAPGLYPNLSAVENISLALSLRNISSNEDDILETLKSVQLAKQVYEPIKVYSQGMLQRLKLALCELIPWEILLIDEPFTGLDTQGRVLTEKRIQDWVSPDKSILMVVHDMDWAISHCSRILVIHKGMIGLDEKTESHSDQIRNYYQGLMA
ncbi:MAG: ABC transporter ATP-binding protein [Candidatus Marinimicrobia bacterium]|nr:ABC transporter ATP-binding protein [Candidatus Neomarinimicrobiota bacterium]